LKKERSRKYRALELLRVASQAAFFGLFIYLFIGAHYTGQDYIGSTVQRFFHFDPLLALVTIVSARLVYAYFAYALITVAATVLFGRIFCGWVCPLGAVHQASSFVFKRTKFLKPPREDKASLAPKYYILVAVLVGAVFGLDLAGYLDPLSFLTRSFALAVLPSLAHALSTLTGALYGLGIMGLARAISQTLENWTIHTSFLQGFSIGLLFLGAIALNARKERFWCRYLCPTGALLGLLSRWNLLKLRIDDEKCIKCGLCTQHCETQAHPYPNDKWKSGECIYCEKCASICPTAAIGFPLSARPEKLANVSNVNLSRRKLLLTAGRAARAQVPGQVRQVRPVHAGLPDGRPAAGADRGRPGRDLHADARPQGRLLRVLLLALHPGLPDRGDQEADDRGEEQAQDRHGLGQQEPLHPLCPGQALHRLRRALSGIAQGHQARRGRDQARRRHGGRPEGAGHRHRALHRLRHLREQVPGHGRPGHLRHERGGNAVGDQPPPFGYLIRSHGRSL
jgi:polyferredoxin